MSVELDAKTSEIFEQIKELTFLQTASLVKAFEDEFGITAAAAPVAVAAAGGAAGGDAGAEEASEVSVILKSAGGNKIAVLKEVRAVTGLGLKEAKELVDAAPKAIMENVDKDKAKEIAEKLTAAGGEVEIK